MGRLKLWRLLDGSLGRAAVLGSLLALGSVVFGPLTAGAQVPDVPTGSTLGPAIDKVAALIPSLEPDLTLNVDDTGFVSNFGTGVQLTGSYMCSPLLRLPILPQLVTTKSQSITIAQSANARVRGPGVARATRTDDVATFICDGATHTRSFSAVPDDGSLPFSTGNANAVVRATVCDLLGCTTVIVTPVVDLSGSGF